MKNVSLLLLSCLLFNIVVAQSDQKNKRALLKENERLLAELDENFSKAISLRDSCGKKIAVLDQQIPLLTREYRRLDSLNNLRTACEEKLAYLGIHSVAEAGENLDEQIRYDLSKEWSYADKKQEYDRYLKLRKTFGAPSLEGLSRKEQLAELRSGNEMMHAQLSVIRSIRANLFLLQMELMSLEMLAEKELQLVPSREQKLTDQTQLVEARLNTLKSEFAKKGPKGYDEAYFMLFPDVFPEEFNRILNENNAAQLSGDKVVSEVRIGRYNSGNDVLGSYAESVERKRQAEEELSSHNGKEIVSLPDEPARFSGNIKQYLAENIRYPEVMKEMEYSGKCYLSFVVNDDGKISDIVIRRGAPDCPECDQEALRLIKNMPDWIPATVDGKPVNSRFNLPLSFRLQ